MGIWLKVGKEENMESYYLSKYPIKLCRDYMRHSNIYDKYMYTWEEKEKYFLITFTGESYGMHWAGDRYRDGSRWAGNMPRQSFKVEFADLGEQTGIRVQFISTWLSKSPLICIDGFWERKLDAKRIKIR